jgi:hypothetical protein
MSLNKLSIKSTAKAAQATSQTQISQLKKGDHVYISSPEQKFRNASQITTQNRL